MILLHLGGLIFSKMDHCGFAATGYEKWPQPILRCWRRNRGQGKSSTFFQKTVLAATFEGTDFGVASG
jgi:hypothetical protein